MKAIVTGMLVSFVAFASVSCTSAELCPRTDQNREWSSACFEGEGTARHVKPENAKKIVANTAGYATILISDPRELVAVDRTGAVRIPGIFHTGDFDFPSAEKKLGRFQITINSAEGKAISKCGYFHGSTFEIAIPAIYEQCLAFSQGTAVVCNDCTKICTEPECQNSILVGGQGFMVDSRNKILQEFSLPPLDRACGGDKPGKVVKVTEKSSYLQCTSNPSSPFGKLR